MFYMNKEELSSMLETMSMNQVARSTGKSVTTVRYWMNKYGLSSKFIKIGTAGFHPGPRPGRAPSYVCKCGRTGSENFYPSSTSKCRDCANKSSAEFRRRRRAEIIAHLGGACSKCGYDRCAAALEVHHLNPGTKDQSFATMSGWAWSRVEKEIEKGVTLLCCRCHREEHYMAH